MDACPHCGLPLFGQADPLDPGTAEPGDPSERDTRLLPRLQSAIPSPDDDPELEGARRPRAARSLIVAAVAAAVVVVAAILVLAHPWNPNLYDTRADTPADTSMEGFPGTVDKLSGQDTSSEAPETLTADEATFAVLTGALEEADVLSQELTAEMANLTGAASASPETREAWSEEAEATSLRVSNLIASVQAADVSTGTYAEAQAELVTMGNYLRNRADAITGAWEAILSPGATEAGIAEAVSSAETENRTYANLYRAARGDFELPDAVA